MENLEIIQKEYKIDFSKQETYEAGAMLLTILAYPNVEEKNETRSEVFNALVASALRDNANINEDWSIRKIAIKPIYFTGLGVNSDKILKNFYKEIQQRLQSARVGLLHLRSKIDPETIDALFAKYKSTNRNKSTTSFIEFLKDTGEPIEPHNFISRSWKPTKSVLHIALALLLEINDWDKIHQREFLISDILFDKAFIIRVVNRSITLANDFNTSNLAIQPSDQITFNIRENARVW